MKTQVELTAKRWKLLQLVAWLLFAVGTVLIGLVFWSARNRPDLLALMKADPMVWAGGALWAVALVGDLYARFMAWWHHG